AANVRKMRLGIAGGDRVLAVYMPGPHSYTGEDVAEISFHGSMLIAGEIFSALFEAGMRPAEPGEFTKRAFLNGRIDLSQAEAVNDVIKAGPREAKNLALRQLGGGLKNTLSAVEKELLDATASMEAAIDFPEDVPEPGKDELLQKIGGAASELERLVSGFEKAHFFRDGLRIALAGSVNSGKSSLLNTLLGRDRAIVTSVAGTTRDTLEETADIFGIPCTLIDTAGVRDTEDEVEKEGINRSAETIETSDLTVILFDSSRPLSADDRKAAGQVFARKHISVLSKSDIADGDACCGICGFIEGETGKNPLRISSKTGEGIDLLQKSIYNILISDSIPRDASVMTNARHADCLKSALACLGNAKTSTEAGMPIDFVSIDVRGALSALGQITGSGADTDLLDTIFSGFCIGK
ncbi:MAG: tRNA uridine-5-carboxymethylaminomethyl(34) synthesis GTPase MnmE, partial [Abditibacteriota bacterium]|nr:tRNA uridine-5-carboxymethylaminomethyl(34) synthesis GTPase MnmE [Abditibacteriota bacterium]